MAMSAMPIVPAGDGEADAVEGDGAFFGDVATQVLGNADGEPPIFAFGDEASDAADAVHVALHKVAAEPGAGGEGAFEIYQVAGFFFREIRAAEGFTGEIGGKTLRVEFDYGQAAAIYGDAVAEF